MRALFLEYAPRLQDGQYVFVAKQSIIDVSHENLQKDFKKILSKSKALVS